MTPFQFGDPHRRALGLLHRAETPRTPSVGVLICNPFGQEAVRSHRLFRVLADRLVRSGRDVLRFDYHGTGDSAGDDADGDLPGWQHDIRRAHQELIERSGCSRVIWVGARLGATLALLASAELAVGPDALLAWEPVLSGGDYLALLAHHHEQALRITYSVLPAGITMQPHDEAMGFALGERLRTQLQALEAPALESARAGLRVVVTPASGLAAAQAIGRKAPTGETRVVAFDHAFEWNSEEAIYTAPLVPPDGLRMLVEQIEALG